MLHCSIVLQLSSLFSLFLLSLLILANKTIKTNGLPATHNILWVWVCHFAWQNGEVIVSTQLGSQSKCYSCFMCISYLYFSSLSFMMLGRLTSGSLKFECTKKCTMILISSIVVNISHKFTYTRCSEMFHEFFHIIKLPFAFYHSMPCHAIHLFSGFYEEVSFMQINVLQVQFLSWTILFCCQQPTALLSVEKKEKKNHLLEPCVKFAEMMTNNRQT